PLLLLAFGLALDAVFRPSAAVRDFCWLFPLVGLVAGIFGSSDPVAWPVVLFGGLAVGWTFRFLYDFESPPDPSPLDLPLKVLVAAWGLGTILSLARARTVWAFVHGLRGRVVNSEGLSDAAAIRESLLAFAILAAGAAFFFLLRRSGPAVRENATRAVLIATAVSGGLAVLQVIGLLPEETRPFWKLTGRLSGGATDPNALGLLCGLAIPVLLGRIVSAGRPGWALAALVPLPIGLALSGSRSGFLIAVLGSAGVIALASMPGRVRAGFAVGALALSLALAVLPRSSPGDVGGRLGQLFRSSLSLDDRTSSRPILWRAAVREFELSPVEGGGVGSFAWRLPDLAGVDRGRLALRDNPGSAYLQALAETGIVGLALTLAFLFALARQALIQTRAPDFAGSGAAVLAFVLALAVGSHWMAPEVSLLFFLLAAFLAPPRERRAGLLPRLGVGLLAVSAVFAGIAITATADPAETFRYHPRIGFHGRETGPAGPFRWTRRRFALWAKPGAPEELTLVNSSPVGKPVGLTVRSNGRIRFHRMVPPGRAIRLALWSGRRPHAFLFELDRAYVPKRFGLADFRELGMVAILPDDR
ncbi:MAG TPA: O-antigen ligase family protein, partial [Thermoanaerobaculia bacterium]